MSDVCKFDTDGDGDCHRCVRSPGGCSAKLESFQTVNGTSKFKYRWTCKGCAGSIFTDDVDAVACNDACWNVFLITRDVWRMVEPSRLTRIEDLFARALPSINVARRAAGFPPLDFSKR